ncbi:MAG: SpoIIE family protein phosphatase [Chloroflexota bacterium]
MRTRLQPTGPAIGLSANQNYWVAESVLAPGEMLYAYTDGVTERAIPRGKHSAMTGWNRCCICRQKSGRSSGHPSESALETYTREAVPYDDITMLALRRYGNDE